MVDSECFISKTVAIQDWPLSDLCKAGVPISLCMHIRDMEAWFGLQDNLSLDFL